MVKGDRIASISNTPPKSEISHTIDGTGMTALPGFIDAHVHFGNSGTPEDGPPPPEYIFKLWLGHGITTVRDVGALLGLEWPEQQAELAEAGKNVAPRIVSYPTFPGTEIVYDAKALLADVRAMEAKAN